MAKPWEMFGEAVQTVKDTAGAVVDTVTENVGKATDLVTSSAGQAYVKQFFNPKQLDEKLFNEKEFSALKTIALDRIGANSSGISYKHYNEGAGKGLGYSGEIKDVSDPSESIKMTLGKATIVRDGNKIVVADTYDIQGKHSEKAIADNMDFADKVKYLMDIYQDENVSTYGMIHAIGELFGSGQKGAGIPVRAVVGELEELGLTEDDVKHLTSLQDYDAKNKPAEKKEAAKPAEPKKTMYLDTSTVFKRYGVVGGESTLDALKSSDMIPKNFSWDTHALVTDDGKVLGDGDRIPKGLNVRVRKK